MIESSGLNRAQAVEVLGNGAPGSPMVRTLSGRMVANDFPPNFAVKLMAKDLAYAMEEGVSLNVPLKTAQAGRDVFEAASAGGWGEQDISAVIEFFRRGRVSMGK